MGIPMRAQVNRFVRRRSSGLTANPTTSCCFARGVGQGLQKHCAPNWVLTVGSNSRSVRPATGWNQKHCKPLLGLLERDRFRLPLEAVPTSDRPLDYTLISIYNAFRPLGKIR